MEFLGVNISWDGFEMEDKKVADMQDWQHPTSVCSVHKFIGFMNFYCHWILGFANITWPLHNLFQKNQPWQWTENEQATFKVLKPPVSQVPVFMHANSNRQFWMETNISNYAYGAVLSQKQADDHHHLIGFMLKLMDTTEHNYGTVLLSTTMVQYTR